MGEVLWSTGPIPRLPLNIRVRLKSPSPIDPAQTVADQFFLLLFPGEVDTKELNLNLAGEIAKTPKMGGCPSAYRQIWEEITQEHGEIPFSNPRWALVSKEIIVESRGKNYAEAEAIVEKLGRLGELKCQIPKTLEAVIYCFAKHVSSGKRPYDGETPWTYTYTRDTTESYHKGYHIRVEGFIEQGVHVHLCFSGDGDGDVGVGVIIYL
jgi:hypothetical protein